VNPLALQYGAGAGHASFRRALAAYLQRTTGDEVNADELFLTCGNSHAIAFATRLFLHDFDTVIMEDPSYFIATDIFDMSKARIVGIPVDEEGMDVERLELLIRADGVRPRIVYTVPNFHNPTGCTMSTARRDRLVELAREFQFIILSDEPYNLLSFEGSERYPTSLVHHDHTDEGVVLAAGTFSKIFAPGLRLGWIHARKPLIDRLKRHGSVMSGGGTAPFTAFAMQHLLETQKLHETVQKLQVVFARRCRALCDALRTHLPEGCTFVEPKGGYFVWVELPASINAADVLRIAAEKYKTRFLPGERCGITLEGKEKVRHCFRLSFAFYTEDELQHAAENMAKAIQELV